MCGIAGLYKTGLDAQSWRDTLGRMAGALRHRGPDDEGIWLDEARGLGLVHRRLAVLDLSSEGHQPMLSPDGRHVLVYNGEIYNFQELKAGLLGRGWSFKSSSDTEVLLALLVLDGLEATLSRIKGMFAFAWWDADRGVLSLARDHSGIKPLYYGWNRGAFYFASELHALRAVPFFDAQVERGVLPLYLRHNYIPAPYSVYAGICKLEQGHFLVLRPAGGEAARPKPYWSLKTVTGHGARAVVMPFEEASRELERRLSQVIKLHTLSDVPLGCFLSGGIDSSLVAALLQAGRGKPLKTFTIGFEDPAFNEAGRAAQIAKHLGTEHHELILRPSDMLGRLPHILSHCDEPFADSSQIPTWFVSDLARRSVTVALSGDGGDELFGGYDRYKWGEVLWRQSAPWPRLPKALLGAGIRSLSPRTWAALAALGRPRAPTFLGQAQFGQRMHRFARTLCARSALEMYHNIMTHTSQAGRYVAGSAELPSPFLAGGHWIEELPLFERMMALDEATYLPDDILTKVDRASMQVSLESRVPYLYPDIIEFAWGLPLEHKVRAGKGKAILRSILARYLPEMIMDQPKMGFSIPLAAWFRRELRDWAGDLLSGPMLKRHGLLDAREVGRAWDEHQSGLCDHASLLWCFAVLQHWSETVHAKK